MLDLKKLEQQLKQALASETIESFSQWLIENRLDTIKGWNRSNVNPFDNLNTGSSVIDLILLVKDQGKLKTKVGFSLKKKKTNFYLYDTNREVTNKTILWKYDSDIINEFNLNT